MNLSLRLVALFGVAIATASVLAADSPEVGANSPSQAAADLIRSAAGTDGAFLAAGLVKSDFQKDKPESILQYPTEDVVVLNLTPAQLKQAFERSLSLYPQPNASFLQISGFEVTFKKAAAAGSRVVSITANGAALQEGKTYSVAMPTSLGRGGLGYFKIWDKTNIARTLAGTTVESALRGKTLSDTSPRWQSLP